MRRRTRWVCGLLALTVLLPGCLKFKHVEDDRSIMLDAKDVQGLMEVPAQPKDMEVTVTATSSPAAPITLYLVAKTDDQQVMSDLEQGRDSSKILARSTQSETPTLQATAPANKDCTVIAASAGGLKTEVKGHIIGKY
jgi:hypothetical protein